MLGICNLSVYLLLFLVSNLGAALGGTSNNDLRQSSPQDRAVFLASKNNDSLILTAEIRHERLLKLRTKGSSDNSNKPRCKPVNKTHKYGIKKPIMTKAIKGMFSRRKSFTCFFLPSSTFQSIFILLNDQAATIRKLGRVIQDHHPGYKVRCQGQKTSKDSDSFG